MCIENVYMCMLIQYTYVYVHISTYKICESLQACCLAGGGGGLVGGWVVVVVGGTVRFARFGFQVCEPRFGSHGSVLGQRQFFVGSVRMVRF